jgi:ABC-type branched-subunit amino acid transport system substrate-binding protein
MFSVFDRARKTLGRATAALTALTLAACVPAGGPGGSGPAVRPGETVQVALLVPSGSGQATDDFMARSMQNAARLAISDLGGQRIDLRVYPTGGSPQMASSQAIKAVDEGAKIILGPLYAQEANAAGVAVASRGVNVLALSNNADIAGGNVFILGPTFSNIAEQLARYAVSQGKGRALIVHGQGIAGEAGRDALQAGISRAGGDIAGIEGYEVSQNGIVAATPRIVARARDTSAQSIFMTANLDADLPLLTQLLRDNGIAPPSTAFVGLGRWDTQTQALTLPGLQGGWFALPDPALYNQFVARYQAAYGEAPHATAGLAYDGIAAIGALLNRGGNNPLSANALTQGSGFAGVNGIFRLRRDGTNERGLAIATIRNNQMVILEPAPRSFRGAGF